jgi:hypothetical protein
MARLFEAITRQDPCVLPYLRFAVILVVVHCVRFVCELERQ